jgi:hypothetical protein
MRADLFEDSTIGAPTPQPKAPHIFRFVRSPRDPSEDGLYCRLCGFRMNEAGEFCTGKRAVE